MISFYISSTGTYSNLYNHPKLIVEPKKVTGQKWHMFYRSVSPIPYMSFRQYFRKGVIEFQKLYKKHHYAASPKMVIVSIDWETEKFFLTIGKICPHDVPFDVITWRLDKTTVVSNKKIILFINRLTSCTGSYYNLENTTK